MLIALRHKMAGRTQFKIWEDEKEMSVEITWPTPTKDMSYFKCESLCKFCNKGFITEQRIELDGSILFVRFCSNVTCSYHSERSEKRWSVRE